jgi:hypothetical protein
MCAPDAPPAPDYVGAANAQGQANVDAARATAKLNNPNVITPYGSQTVTYGHQPTSFDQAGYDAAMQAASNQDSGLPTPTRDQFTTYSPGDPDIGTVTQSLSPQQQALFNQYQDINTKLGGVAQTGVGYVQDTLDHPFDQSALPSAPVDAGQTGQDAIMARLQPQIERNNAQLESRLANQGIMQGSEAYNNANTLQAQANNDQYTQAGLAGIGLSEQARQQAIQEQEFFRSEPLNMLNSVRSAAPVNVPQFGQAQGAQVSPANYQSAAQNQYNGLLNIYGQQVGAANSQTQAAAMGLGAYFGSTPAAAAVVA